MAKEMMIVFVYDTARCSREDDDPAEAVMYFHPAWVSSTQRLALAGQLMGVNQFLTTSFAAPYMISLQGGKFVLKKFGQYILAVGTDRNIYDWILERRADILESLLQFFHCDFNTILSSLNNDKNKFTEKLYQMFETYLPILQYSASLFSNTPVLKLPRSASNVFLEAIEVLQYCQETNGVIGGALFYNNKVIVSQLSAEMTKTLVITDPYRIKAPAERLSTSFHLPVGVQLLSVYIEQREFKKMQQDTNIKQIYSSHSERFKENGVHKKETKSNSKDQSISLMKRDTSRIFTVPEESELETNLYRTVMRRRSPSPPASCESPSKRKDESKLDRSKYPNPLTPSVCSTPLKDVNRILHGNAVSICSAAEEFNSKTEADDDTQYTEKKVKQIENMDDIPDVVKEALRCKRLIKLRNAPSREKLVKKKEPSKRSLSMSDLVDSQKPSNRISLRAYSLGLSKLDCINYEIDGSRKIRNDKKFNTISDPCYPIFRCDGLPVSDYLYKQYIATHYSDKKVFEEQKCTRKLELTSLNSKDGMNNNVQTCSAEGSETQRTRLDIPLDVRLENGNKTKQETYRRSMSLPLKPLNAYDNDDRRKSTSECSGIFELPQRRKLDGLQLTPLMSKLSLLADERTSGFCSRETTPSEFRDLSSNFSLGTTRTLGKNQSEPNKDSGSHEDEIVDDWTNTSKESEDFVKSELFLCGHQNMVMVLLMEDGIANNPELIHSFWKTCINTLGRLESQLQQCLDPLPSNESKELYSVLSVDSEWDTVHRSGLWGVTELEMVSLLHDRFSKARNLTDIIVRTEDTVLYGNQCGKAQVFYQQAMSSNTSGGLPTPADLMGIVPLKAKRRLERDHGILLL